MARKAIILVLALLAIVGLVSAADKAGAPAAAITKGAAGGEGATASEAPLDDNAIGNTGDNSGSAAASPGDDDVAVAGPLGSDSTYSVYPPAESPKSSSAALGIPAVAGLAAAATDSFFFFF